METLIDINKKAKQDAEACIRRFRNALSYDIMGYSIRPKHIPTAEDDYKLTKDACFLAMEHLNFQRLGYFNRYGELDSKHAKKKFNYYDKIYKEVVKIRSKTKIK